MKDNTSIDAVERVTEPDPDTKRRAVRAIASNATDAVECSEFLAMLGLTAEDGLTNVTEAAA